jgi:hypothetical protein
MLGKAAYVIKSDARWKEMLENQSVKINLEKERVAVKKRKEDFVFMTTTWTRRRRRATWRNGSPSCYAPTPENKCGSNTCGSNTGGNKDVGRALCPRTVATYIDETRSTGNHGGPHLHLIHVVL